MIYYTDTQVSTNTHKNININIINYKLLKIDRLKAKTTMFEHGVLSKDTFDPNYTLNL